MLGLGRARFQALVDASEPTARDLAQVVSDRNVPAQPRADRIPLPAWTGRLDDVTVKALTVYVHSLGGGER